MTPQEREELVSVFETPPFKRYKKWTFQFEYPGYFVYYHDDLPLSIFFTPDHTSQNVVDLQVTYKDDTVELQASPFYSNTAEDLFAIVRQWLDFSEANVMNATAHPKHFHDWRPDKAPWTPL